MRNKKRCRVHGGTRGSGGQRGNCNALKHGLTTTMVRCFKRAVKTVIYETRQLTEELMNKTN